ncbi:hypothetical protein HNP46_000032 [Pseudomonas nitritireducens]|uniref:ATPase AAA-type core domain-containing protein n=1 Tax=Pseudomonas nitroreducens TaxID=46680 RepID=A0A7W7KE78_PSENT|nr:ATP-binding protein [Pseudomonas nitritireducens]MBB4861221.1 hypothetical protein [Pseudomonas nitritireducens]
MSLRIPVNVLQNTTHQRFNLLRSPSGSARDSVHLPLDDYEDDLLEDILKAAVTAKDKRSERALEAIISSRKHREDIVVPSFLAFHQLLTSYLAKDAIDSWLYMECQDGSINPVLITKVDYSTNSYGSKLTEKVTINVAYVGRVEERGDSSLSLVSDYISFSPEGVARKKVSAILAAQGLQKETPELKAAYVEQLKVHKELTEGAFAKQFRFSGRVYKFDKDNYNRKSTKYFDCPVVNDLHDSDVAPLPTHADLQFLPDDNGQEFTGEIPHHTIVPVFDLLAQETFWVSSGFLTPYAYRPELRDELVLPESHTDLLDILTADIEDYRSDVVEGKVSGNIILCAGEAGLGKTLTAEIYAEIVQRPLLRAPASMLGTDATSVSNNLDRLFGLCRRLGLIMLLDEVDVYVAKRDLDIGRNAVVSEMLRKFEYFGELIFATTNRPDEIDQAFKSRCAAIIRYDYPTPDNAAAIWKKKAEAINLALPDELVSKLVTLFPQLAPRDTRELVRLAARHVDKKGCAVDIDLFRKIAMFRDVKMVAATDEAAHA